MAKQVGVPLCSAVREWHSRDYKACAAHIDAVLPLLQTIGGSHAQRELFAQLSLQAAVRGQLQHAVHAAKQRTCARPESHAAWSTYATVLEYEAKVARSEAARLAWVDDTTSAQASN